jgi:hypothetical protein
LQQALATISGQQQQHHYRHHHNNHNQQHQYPYAQSAAPQELQVRMRLRACLAEWRSLMLLGCASQLAYWP